MKISWKSAKEWLHENVMKISGFIWNIQGNTFDPWVYNNSAYIPFTLEQYMEFVLNTISTNSTFSIFPLYKNYIIPPSCTITGYSNMTSFKRFESKPVIKIILIYDRLNLWRHRQFIMIFYQFLHIRIEIIHGTHVYILF